MHDLGRRAWLRGGPDWSPSGNVSFGELAPDDDLQGLVAVVAQVPAQRARTAGQRERERRRGLDLVADGSAVSAEMRSSSTSASSSLSPVDSRVSSSACQVSSLGVVERASTPSAAAATRVRSMRLRALGEVGSGGGGEGHGLRVRRRRRASCRSCSAPPTAAPVGSSGMLVAYLATASATSASGTSRPASRARRCAAAARRARAASSPARRRSARRRRRVTCRCARAWPGRAARAGVGRPRSPGSVPLVAEVDVDGEGVSW